MGEVLHIEEHQRAERPPQEKAMAVEEQNGEPIYYGTKDVARFLGCSIPKAREIMKRRDFPKIEDGRLLRVYKGALEKWSMERRT